MIEGISGSLLGASVPREMIQEAFDKMKEQDFIKEISQIGREATSAGAELAVKGAIWVGRADGFLSDDEARHIAAIASALGVNEYQLRNLVADADRVFDKITASTQSIA